MLPLFQNTNHFWFIILKRRLEQTVMSCYTGTALSPKVQILWESHKIWKISHLFLELLGNVNQSGRFFQNCVTFLEYPNFISIKLSGFLMTSFDCFLNRFCIESTLLASLDYISKAIQKLIFYEWLWLLPGAPPFWKKKSLVTCKTNLNRLKFKL